MSDKDHVAGPPTTTAASHKHAMPELTKPQETAPALRKVKAAPSNQMRSKPIATLTGPVTSITAANFRSTSTIWLNEADEDAPATHGGSVVVRILPGSANYSTDPTHAFSPSRLVVKAGTRVTFFNTDNMIHFNKDDKGEFHTPMLRAGMSFSHIFSKPGTFNYHCIPHEWMKGTIIVR